MKINNNISAVITNAQLLGTENSMAKSMEKLASGIKLNHASDSPSGMAISGRMRAQIRGLDRASDNSSDANNALTIAEGALSEVTDMLQRMRELAVQAANGTNTVSERRSCQEELAKLRDEIDRVSSTTQYNGKNLLDGSLDARVYADKDNIGNVSRLQVNDNVSEGEYGLSVTSVAKQANLSTGLTVSSLVGRNAKLDINGSRLEITSDMNGDDIYKAVRDAAEIGGCTIPDAASPVGSTPINFTSANYGVHAEINLKSVDDTDIFGTTVSGLGTNNPRYGVDPVVTLDTTNSAFSSHATVSYDGNKLTITDMGGFEMTMLLSSDMPAPVAPATTTNIRLNVTDIGIMDVQVGANEGQLMSTRLPEVSSKSLYLDKLDLTTTNGPWDAMDRLEDAITRLSEVRAEIGADVNRLEYTVNYLDATEENMTSALSRLTDTDMAEEMTEYTKLNVLQQASTSMLAQANELPSLALQLLQ